MCYSFCNFVPSMLSMRGARRISPSTSDHLEVQVSSLSSACPCSEQLIHQPSRNHSDAMGRKSSQSSGKCTDYHSVASQPPRASRRWQVAHTDTFQRSAPPNYTSVMLLICQHHFFPHLWLISNHPETFIYSTSDQLNFFSSFKLQLSHLFAQTRFVQLCTFPSQNYKAVDRKVTERLKTPGNSWRGKSCHRSLLVILLICLSHNKSY